MFRVFGLLALVPTTILLTISFFVLFAQKKLESNGLKTFGLIVAVLLWIAAGLVFSTGLLTLATGRPLGFHKPCGEYSEMHPGWGPGWQHRMHEGPKGLRGPLPAPQAAPETEQAPAPGK